MATTFTTDTSLGYPAAGDRAYDTVVNQTIIDLDANNALADLKVTLPTSERAAGSSSLNVRVAAGSYRKADGTIGTYAGTSSFALTASSTNYLYLTDGGTLTKNTTGWPAATNIVRLATVTTDTDSVTGIADERVAWRSAGAGATVTMTQTYSVADATLGAYTSDTESVAYTGAADGEAKLVDLNNLRVAYENLRNFTEDLAKFVNSLVDALQAKGIVG